MPIVRSTWIVALLLALSQAAGLAVFLQRQNAVAGGVRFIDASVWAFRLTTMVTLTAGSACLMWIGDRITARQAGNGMFLVFLAALLAGFSRLAGWPDATFALTRLAVPVAIAGLVSSGYRRAFQLS